MADQGPVKNDEDNPSLNTKQQHRKGEDVDDNIKDGQVKNNSATCSTNQPRLCKPYPFDQYHNSCRYIIKNIIDIPESGHLNLIKPCHEYKAFISTTDQTKMIKFIREVIHFSAACMNSRTNGTIHFGIGDKPDFIHGQVLGVVVEDKEAFANELKSAIDRYFEHKHKQAAQICIRPPRFVEVLNKNIMSSDKYVIEVDIVPDSTICEENIYHTFTTIAQSKGRVKSKTKHFFIRDGSSSRDLLAPTTIAKPKVEYNKFVGSVGQLVQLRKKAEEKHLNIIKSSTQGSKLSQMITCRSLSLDNSFFEQYVIVANKSHSSQFESLGFLVELNPTAVLDFAPESANQGLQCHFDLKSAVNVHLPGRYKITEGVEEIANKLKLTHQKINKVKNNSATCSTNQPRLCKPYPFDQYRNSCRYIIKNIIDIPESGPLNLIEPCHEYKAFTNTTDETKMNKFTAEVVRFAAACMNCRTNGTIHFGIGDKPDFIHGQVLGVVVEDKEAYANELKSAIDGYFEHKHKQTARICIRPPRFVGVLNKNMTSSDKCVIEVDIVPDSTICEENIYHTFNMIAQSKGIDKVKKKFFFVRDGSSSRDLLAPTTIAKPKVEYNKFVGSVGQLVQLRKKAEEKHLNIIKSSTQGSKLSQMITCRSLSLDNSFFEQYVIVANKSHSSQFESLGFLVELNPTAVLDFDPESANQGLQCHFDLKSAVNVHLPGRYKITEGVEEIANKLKLTRNTSWVFCNGSIENEVPSDINQWLMDKGASVRDVISFLCRKDVLPNKRFLVTFLLLSTVSEKMDPLVETFSTFWQELRGTDQILCICDSENAFTSWKDLIEARCGIDISSRCIYELSFAEVNGTVLSLFSRNRRAIRFLPCGGGSKVLLEKKVERGLNTLDILCVNQCEGGNENKIAIEENFYKGGKVSWWNFAFSECGSSQLIKRGYINSISDTILDMCSLPKTCVLFNLLHVPGCGGTTLAMHTLWSLRDKFRCAVLKDTNAEFSQVAEQVVKLLTYDHEEQLPRVPVLLMIDDFDDMRKVSDMQQAIEQKCRKNIKSVQVIILNCMRSESPELTEAGERTLFIGNSLSCEEQIHFEQKTFYTFMLMKKNLKPEYFQGVVRNSLRSFSINEKQSKVLAVLTLMNVYANDKCLPFSLCETFLHPNPRPICGADRSREIFGNFSNLICLVTVKNDGEYKAVKMIHPNISKCCWQELTRSHKVTKADIINVLKQMVDEHCENAEDKHKLLKVHPILKRSAQDRFTEDFYQAFSKLENFFKSLLPRARLGACLWADYKHIISTLWRNSDTTNGLQ